jgi:hypothetical protein
MINQIRQIKIKDEPNINLLNTIEKTESSIKKEPSAKRTHFESNMMVQPINKLTTMEEILTSQTALNEGQNAKRACFESIVKAEPKAESNIGSSPQLTSKKSKNEIKHSANIKFEEGEWVEAKENGLWYKAKIIAVFNIQKEVIVHYFGWNRRFDTFYPMESGNCLRSFKEDPENIITRHSNKGRN